VSAGASSLLASVALFIFYNGLEGMESPGMLKETGMLEEIGMVEEMLSLLNLSLAHIRPQHALSEQLVGDTKTVPESLDSPA
jgi:hypothetical protein